VHAITGEVDRVYFDAPRRLTMQEPERRVVHRRPRDSTMSFVWNPGALRAAELKDMEPGGEQHMLCVEAAAVQKPVRLHPDDRWTGSQTLIVITRSSTQATRLP
jgi:glucose-6-phosphate 1-epimerase